MIQTTCITNPSAANISLPMLFFTAAFASVRILPFLSLFVVLLLYSYLHKIQEKLSLYYIVFPNLFQINIPFRFHIMVLPVSHLKNLRIDQNPLPIHVPANIDSPLAIWLCHPLWITQRKPNRRRQKYYFCTASWHLAPHILNIKMHLLVYISNDSFYKPVITLHIFYRW